MYFRNYLGQDMWREMDRIQKEMNRLFNNASTGDQKVYPAMNVWSNNDNAYVTAELPGYEAKNLHITVTGNELQITGNREPEKLKDDEQVHRQERVTGKFERAITLPFAIEESKVDAKYEKGILNITLPRAEADKPKKIEIKAK